MTGEGVKIGQNNVTYFMDGLPGLLKLWVVTRKWVLLLHGTSHVGRENAIYKTFLGHRGQSFMTSTKIQVFDPPPPVHMPPHEPDPLPVVIYLNCTISMGGDLVLNLGGPKNFRGPISGKN